MNLALPRREGKEGRDPFFFPLLLFFFSLSFSPPPSELDRGLALQHSSQLSYPFNNSLSLFLFPGRQTGIETAREARSSEAGGEFGNRKSAVYQKIASALFSERQIAAKRRAPPPLSFPSLFSFSFFSLDFRLNQYFRKFRIPSLVNAVQKFGIFPILDTFFLILVGSQVKFLLGTQDFFNFCIFLGKKMQIPISCPWPAMMAVVGWRWQQYCVLGGKITKDQRKNNQRLARK